MDENTRRVEEIRWGLSTNNGFALQRQHQPSPADSVGFPGDARFDIPSHSWSPYDGQLQLKRLSNPLGGQRTELRSPQLSAPTFSAPSVGASADSGHVKPEAPLPDKPPATEPRGLKRKAGSELPYAESSLTAVELEAGKSLRNGSQNPPESTVGFTQRGKNRQQSATPSPQKANSTLSRGTTEHASSGERPSHPRRASAKDDEDETTGRRKAISASKGKSHEVPRVLPHESVFPIQIGCELFKLSGASISSDAPSYFSQFFERELQKKGGDGSGGVRTLYIDRDPTTFRDISRHLQGYYVQPRDGAHFVKLFADAQFYSLPRLTSQLFESDIFIQIGGRDFQISRDIFSSPGDSPNFFTLGFAISFSTPSDIFPGLMREGLLRPPSMSPPSVINRSAKIFAELLDLLKGYPLHIRDEEHRAALLRDCRYFYFRGLEQKLIPHHVAFNPGRGRTDIVIRLDDIRPSGISIMEDMARVAAHALPETWVSYARPFADDSTHELIVELGGSCTTLDLRTMQATFQGPERVRVTSLFQNISSKVGEEKRKQDASSSGAVGVSSGSLARGSVDGSGEGRLAFEINQETSITLDGKVFLKHRTSPVKAYEPGQDDHDYYDRHDHVQAKVAKTRSEHMHGSVNNEQNGGRARQIAMIDWTSDVMPDWTVETGQWRLRVQDPVRTRGVEIVLVAVKLDAHSDEGAWNARRSFLRS